MSVLDYQDLTACANKVRKPGYWHVAPVIEGGFGVLNRTWVPDRSTVDCKYDRRRVDPACAKAKCPRIEQ